MHSGFVGVLPDASRAAPSVTIFFVVFCGAGERVPTVLLLLATVLIGWTHHFTGGSDDGALALAFDVLCALFLWAAMAVMLRDLFRTPGVGVGSVLGAICGYLIAGRRVDGHPTSALSCWRRTPSPSALAFGKFWGTDMRGSRCSATTALPR